MRGGGVNWRKEFFFFNQGKYVSWFENAPFAKMSQHINFVFDMWHTSWVPLGSINYVEGVLSSMVWDKWSVSTKFDHAVNCTNCIWFVMGMGLLKRKSDLKMVKNYHCWIYNHKNTFVFYVERLIPKTARRTCPALHQKQGAWDRQAVWFKIVVMTTS